MFSFGYFPGVRLSFADVSEPSVRSIFKGWMKNILHPAFEDGPDRGFRNVGKLLLYIQPLKMDLTEGSETLAKLNLTPGKYPKENI
jgi:hypothetical protein